MVTFTIDFTTCTTDIIYTDEANLIKTVWSNESVHTNVDFDVSLNNDDPLEFSIENSAIGADATKCGSLFLALDNPSSLPNVNLNQGSMQVTVDSANLPASVYEKNTSITLLSW